MAHGDIWETLRNDQLSVKLARPDHQRTLQYARGELHRDRLRLLAAAVTTVVLLMVLGFAGHAAARRGKVSSALSPHATVPTVSVSANQRSITESAAGGHVDFIVRISKRPATTVSVSYTTSGSATRDDYQPRHGTGTGTVQFRPDGSTYHVIMISLTTSPPQDGQTLTLVITLSDPSKGVAIGKESSAAVRLIRPNSPPGSGKHPPVPQVAVAAVRGVSTLDTCNDTTATFPVSVSPTIGSPLTVQYTYTISGIDEIGPVHAHIQIPANQQSVPIDVDLSAGAANSLMVELTSATESGGTQVSIGESSARYELDPSCPGPTSGGTGTSGSSSVQSTTTGPGT